MDLRIRAMLPSDLQHIGPLYREMLSELSEGQYPDVSDREREIENFEFFLLAGLRGPGNFGAFVAVDGKVAKGFICGAILNRAVGQPARYLLGETLFVTKNFRHKGIGNSLVRTICEWGIANGAGAFEVSFKPGTLAHKNWARMGFRSYLAGAVLADEKMKPILDYPEFQAPNEEKKVIGE